MTDDDELMQRLRRIADEVDAPPELVAETARAALSTRRLDEELAELLHDSDLTTPQLVRGAGGPGGPRSLSFETVAVSLELEIEQADSHITVSGVVSGSSGEVTVETTTEGPRRAQIDDNGWFRVTNLPRGAMRVHVTATDGSGVTTRWIRT
jgi:hypothetical protein